MCMNDAIPVIIGFLGLISATLLIGSILGFRKARKNKEKSPTELK